MSKSGMNDREEARLLALIKKEGSIQEGDKCPMDGCRGILEDSSRCLINTDNVETPLFGFGVFACDRKKCKFPAFITKEESARVKAWQAETEEATA